MEPENGEADIYIVTTTNNKEQAVAKKMAQFCINYNSGHEKKLDVRAILAPEELKGYILVEAVGQDVVDTLIENVPYAKSMLSGCSSVSEIEHFLKPKPVAVGITEGSVIEITSGPFKGETARVKRLGSGQHGEEITVELFDAVVPIPITIRSDIVRIVKREE